MLFLAFLTILSVTAQQTSIPDQNFEQALIDLGHDYILDGRVLTANIGGITSLSVTHKNISDLTGIEDFTALEVLNCGGNILPALDMSNNIVLSRLLCTACGIATLYVSNNKALTQLNCSANDLVRLDVSNNIFLRNLVCGNNALAALDVSNNPALIQLLCSDNVLTSLNVKNGNNGNLSDLNNPDLVCIEVDDVEFSNSNWSDIVDNTAIFFSKFRWL